MMHLLEQRQLRNVYRSFVQVSSVIILLQTLPSCVLICLAKINIPLSSQTVICTNLLLLHLTTTTYILTKKPDIYIYMEPLITIHYIQQLPVYVKYYYAFFAYNYMFDHIFTLNSMINIICSFHIDYNITRTISISLYSSQTQSLPKETMC